MISRTVHLPDPGSLEAYLTPTDSTAFLCRGEGIIGLGILERHVVETPEQADALWAEMVANLHHDSELPEVFGTGPLAFGSFAFDPGNTSGGSVLVVPRVVLGRRDGVSWCTWTGHDAAEVEQATLPTVQDAPPAHGPVEWRDGSMTPKAWQDVVVSAVERLRDPGTAVEKVVLARDLVARAERPIDVRLVLMRLQQAYPTTWTYLVDGLVGATPEMLVRRDGGRVTSRVLAGTIRRRGADQQQAMALAQQLAASSKDREEHAYAVRSVAEALAPHCTTLDVPEAPHVLDLPNVMHLATDITGVARPGASSLALAGALHPSAAVCGTPTDVARTMIAEVEGMDRGRYAGPVGWMDAEGNGEWALALRGGMLCHDDPRELRVFAGCGIVADSDPASELAETRAKLLPMREAIGD